MRHVRPSELLVPDRRILRPCSFIPGLSPAPKIIGASREVNPGSQSWTTPGTFNWPVPLFNNLTIVVRAPGGGGGGAVYAIHDPDANRPCGVNPTPAGWTAPTRGGNGANGGASQFTVTNYVNMVATGGIGGTGGDWNWTSPGAPGANGVGSGGNVQNYNGSGFAGGTYGTFYESLWIGQAFAAQWGYGSSGGVGGRCDSLFTLGQIPQGSNATIVVGSAGGPGFQVSNYNYMMGVTGSYPTAAQVGSVSVSWN